MVERKFEVERKLIVELTRFLDYDKAKIEELIDNVCDFPYVLGHLAYNRVGGVAYYVLFQCGLLKKMNREFVTVIKTLFEMNKIKNEGFKSALCYFSKLFDITDFDYAFLKGAYLSSHIYPDGLRTSNDFDILLETKDLTKCEEILLKERFVQGHYSINDGIKKADRKEIISSKLNRGETVPFFKEYSKPGFPVLEVDLNFSLDYKPEKDINLVTQMLQHAEPMHIQTDRQLLTLSLEDFLIHLCVHLYKEASVYQWVLMGRDLSLYKFMDIYAFTMKHNSEGFWKRLYQKINAYKLFVECYYTFLYTAELYPCLRDMAGFNGMLQKLKKDSPNNMNQITHPAENKTYYYDADFIDWFFEPNRKSLLKEKDKNAEFKKT